MRSASGASLTAASSSAVTSESGAGKWARNLTTPASFICWQDFSSAGWSRRSNAPREASNAPWSSSKCSRAADYHCCIATLPAVVGAEAVTGSVWCVATIPSAVARMTAATTIVDMMIRNARSDNRRFLAGMIRASHSLHSCWFLGLRCPLGHVGMVERTYLLRTTITGAVADSATAVLTEPRSMPGKPPRPRLPTTTS